MTPANTEVYRHLAELKNYLDKDLEKIHELYEMTELITRLSLLDHTMVK